MLWRIKYDLIFPMPASDIYRRFIRFKEREKKWQDLNGYNKRVISVHRETIQDIRIDRQSGSFVACVGDSRILVYSIQGEIILDQDTNSIGPCIDLFHQVDQAKLLVAAGCMDG